MSSEPSETPRDEEFSQRFKKMSRRPRVVVQRVLIVVLPAMISALGGYMKVKAEAANGYEALAAHVEKQGEAIEQIQKENAEWRSLLVGALLKGTPQGEGKGSAAMDSVPSRVRPPTAMPMIPIQREALKKLGERPSPSPVRFAPLPKSLDLAQQKSR